MSLGLIDYLSWDSDFFNRKVGQICKVSNLDESEKSSFDILYVNSSKNIEIKGFKKTLEQTKVIFSKKINRVIKERSGNVYSVFKTNEYTNQLNELAFESGKHSRFLKDRFFGVDKFKELYQKWVENSLNGKFANDVLIYKSDDEIKGFVTYKIKNGFAQIGLIAVSPKAQGLGIGSILINEVESLLYQDSITELRIPTQLENELACKFYTKLGYTIIEKEYIQHFWNYDTIQ